ncbi:MAG: ABC transporter ATP-binding protein [Segetibacter sp.]
MGIAIHVENLSKAYRLGEIGTGTISRDLERWFAKVRGKEDPFLKIGEENDRTTKGTSDVVWSIKDINLEIQQGDAVGVIGRNGAGKSTLLKLLSRVTAPTSGIIKAKGRIASLLEVGTGFHPELTGKENIYLNGAILGMRKKEIQRKFDEIVDFAAVSRYVDTPVKRYSSGMYVRLAFAVAAHLDSEILIVDEVLAVGDAEFQKKCLGKMGEVSKGEGRTVLFVSHQMSSIRSLCNNCVLLKNGRLQTVGKAEDVIDLYIDERNKNGIKNIKYYDKYLKYVSVRQEEAILVIEAEYDSNFIFDIPHLGFIIFNSHNQPVFGSNPTLSSVEYDRKVGTKKGKVIINVENPKLTDGEYTASIWFGDSGYNFIEDKECLSFEVSSMTLDKHASSSSSGNVIPETSWKFEKYE